MAAAAPAARMKQGPRVITALGRYRSPSRLSIRVRGASVSTRARHTRHRDGSWALPHRSRRVARCGLRADRRRQRAAGLDGLPVAGLRDAREGALALRVGATELVHARLGPVARAAPLA